MELEFTTIGKSSTQRGNVRSNYEIPQAWADFLTKFPWCWYAHLTFEGCPSLDTALEEFDAFIRKLNRACFGLRYRVKNGVTWALAIEYQKRQSVHFHVLIGNIPESIINQTERFKRVWSPSRYGAKILVYEKDRGAEYYTSKTTHPWKKGELRFSENLKRQEA